MSNDIFFTAFAAPPGQRRRNDLFAVVAALAGITGGFAQILFNAEQLVVLRHALTAAGGTGFDLAGIHRNRQIGNGGILRLAGTVRHNGGITRAVGHLNGVQGFGQRTDLIQLNQDGVAAAVLNALLQTLGVRYKQIVADQLELIAQACGQFLPAFPVFFIERILQRSDGVLGNQILPERDQLIGGVMLLALRQQIGSLFALPLAGSSIDRQHEIIIGLVAGRLDGAQQVLNRLFVAPRFGA